MITLSHACSNCQRFHTVVFSIFPPTWRLALEKVQEKISYHAFGLFSAGGRRSSRRVRGRSNPARSHICDRSSASVRSTDRRKLHSAARSGPTRRSSHTVIDFLRERCSCPANYDNSALTARPSPLKRSSKANWCFSSSHITNSMNRAGAVPERSACGSVRWPPCSGGRLPPTSIPVRDDRRGRLAQAVVQLLLHDAQLYQRIDAQEQFQGLLLVHLEHLHHQEGKRATASTRRESGFCGVRPLGRAGSSNNKRRATTESWS